MPDNRDQDKERIEAFFKSPAGFWTVVILIGVIAVWSVGGTIVGMFQH